MFCRPSATCGFGLGNFLLERMLIEQCSVRAWSSDVGCESLEGVAEKLDCGRGCAEKSGRGGLGASKKKEAAEKPGKSGGGAGRVQSGGCAALGIG